VKGFAPGELQLTIQEIITRLEAAETAIANLQNP